MEVDSSQIQALNYIEAKKFLKCSTDIYEINNYLACDEIKAYMHKDSENCANSPFGSWVCLEFPFSKSEDIRG
jgi:hypothetical protein